MDALVKSFRHALRGIGFTLRQERNFQVECAVGAGVFVLMFLFPLTSGERGVLLLTIGWVLTLEIINTAFERVMDMLKPRVHPYVRVVKDAVAGAVLVGAIMATGIGITIFLPYWMP